MKCWRRSNTHLCGGATAFIVHKCWTFVALSQHSRRRSIGLSYGRPCGPPAWRHWQHGNIWHSQQRNVAQSYLWDHHGIHRVGG